MARAHRATDDTPPKLPDDAALATALDAVAQPVFVLARRSSDGEAVLVHANAAATALTGRAGERLAGTPFAALVPPADAGAVAALLTTAFRDRVSARIDTQMLRRDVGACPVTLAFRPLAPQTAMPVDAASLVCTATRRIPAGTAADDAAMLREIVDSLDDGIALFDDADRLIFANRRIAAMYPERARLYRPGTALIDLLRAGVEDGSFHSDGVSIEEFIAQLHARRSDVTQELQLNDGRIVRIVRRRIASGRLSVHTDITALKRAYSLLSDAVEAMNEGFALYGPDDRMVVCNRRLREIHAAAADAMVPGTSFADVLRRTMEVGTWTATPDDLDAYIAQRVKRRRDLGENVIERSMSNGHWVRISGKLLPDGHYVAIHSDITEQKRRELDLYEAKRHAELANQAKSGFLANVSHELRTPLNAILGFSELMASEMFGPLGSERYVEYNGDVHASAQHLLALINDLLDMSKIEAGKYTLHDEYFDLAPLVEECVRRIESPGTEGAREIEVRLPADLPQMRADVRAIRQVFLNLLSNATKFTAPGGRIVVSARVEAGELVVAVADDGIGIRPADLARLARPFQQVRDPMASHATGTGLGLSISRSLVELHGGRLEIASEFGLGTTVTFRLPASRNAAEAY